MTDKMIREGVMLVIFITATSAIFISLSIVSVTSAINALTLAIQAAP